jgi:hypothetical protein
MKLVSDFADFQTLWSVKWDWTKHFGSQACGQQKKSPPEMKISPPVRGKVGNFLLTR